MEVDLVTLSEIDAEKGLIAPANHSRWNGTEVLMGLGSQ
jgi:hypothetical protein